MSMVKISEWVIDVLATEGLAKELIHIQFGLLLYCSYCGELHLDKGEYATKPHKWHLCMKCGKKFWIPRQSIGITVTQHKTLTDIADLMKLVMDYSDKDNSDRVKRTIDEIVVLARKIRNEPRS